MPHSPASSSFFARFASRVTAWSGTTVAFSLALGTVLIWAVSGPLFQYS